MVVLNMMDSADFDRLSCMYLKYYHHGYWLQSLLIDGFELDFHTNLVHYVHQKRH